MLDLPQCQEVRSAVIQPVRVDVVDDARVGDAQHQTMHSLSTCHCVSVRERPAPLAQPLEVALVDERKRDDLGLRAHVSMDRNEHRKTLQVLNVLHTVCMSTRSILSLTLRFGLVSIPVGLVPARVDRSTGFTTLHRECGTPVKRPPFCPTHERVVAAEELVLGYEVAKGQFLVVEESELAAIVPEASRSIDIRCLLDADRIDPAQVERTYYLSASETPIGRRPYALLHRVLLEQKRVAIARLVYRGGEWVGAIRPHASLNLLVLQKLCFLEEFVVPTPVELDLRDVELEDQEVELGHDLGAKLWRTKPTPEIFKSEHQVRVRQLVDAKLAGGEIVQAVESEPEPLTLPTVDLTEQLRASLRRRTTRKQPKARAGA